MSFKVRVGIAIVVLACVALISCGCAVTDDKREDGLLVYTLDENPSLKQVISRYEEQHPEKPVNMVVGIAHPLRIQGYRQADIPTLGKCH